MTTQLPSHLPKRLTISFPIWLLYGTEPNSPYYDLDKLMLEHKERGFNCIRFDDGAGLIHDRQGNPIKPFLMRRMFGKFDTYVRQQQSREGMSRDLLKRLIKICEAAKRHDMTLILSSWYYLHTFWQIDSKPLNDSLFAIPDHEVFSAFAGFLDCILCELEARGLADCIAFCEIMNEVDGLEMVGGYGAVTLSPEELAAFRKDHEDAIKMLRERHPKLLFAYDSFTPKFNEALVPTNLQVFNFHSYFLWEIYGAFRDEVGELALVPPQERATIEEIRATRSGQRPADESWYNRISYFANLAPDRIPQDEQWFMKRFERDYNKYLEKMKKSVDRVMEVSGKEFPGVPIVSAEGVSYNEANLLLWEEHCPKYWDLLEEMAAYYNKVGMWGMTPRTCSGPEDPCWHLNKDQLRRVNLRFLEG